MFFGRVSSGEQEKVKAATITYIFTSQSRKDLEKF